MISPFFILNLLYLNGVCNVFYDDPDEGQMRRSANKVVLHTTSVAGVLISLDFFPFSVHRGSR